MAQKKRFWLKDGSLAINKSDPGTMGGGGTRRHFENGFGIKEVDSLRLIHPTTALSIRNHHLPDHPALAGRCNLQIKTYLDNMR
jgi:hypothetical protein